MAPGDRDAQARAGSPVITVALQLLGAVAGIAALMTFAGGAMLWLRFDELRLPADQAVALLPERLLLTTGAHALIGPIAVGILCAVVVTLAWPWRRTPRDWAFWLLLGAIVVVAVVVAAALVWDFDRYPEQFAMLLALLAAFGIVLAVARAAARRSTLAWSLFAAFVVCGAVLAIVRTSGAPKLEPVALLLDGRPQSIAGFYVGQTSDRVYVAPLPGNGDPADPFADAEIDRLVEIRRDKVLGLLLGAPAGIRSDEPGREQAQSLLADLRAATAEPEAGEARAITTSDPVTAFAPVVNLHVRERAWPMSAEDFLAASWLLWAHDGRCEDWLPGSERHVDDVPDERGELGRFDVARLAGPAAYAHAPAAGDCAEDGRAVPADAHTRPYDRGRPAGVDATEGWVLDVDDDAATPRPRLADDGPQRVLRGVPTYYEVQPPLADGTPEVRITYWLFYGLSQPPGPSAVTRFLVHEGDWERIGVLLRRGATRDDYIPISVRYHAHDGNRDVAWRAVRRTAAAGAADATHPLVYSARGSHASYWRAGSYENVFEAGGRRQFAVRDTAVACPDCPQWRTWERLVDAQVQPWYGFGGAWGQMGGIAGTTGPLGPSRWKSGGAGVSPTRTVQLAAGPSAPPAP
jgi:hypothetical protein